MVLTLRGGVTAGQQLHLKINLLSFFTPHNSRTEKLRRGTGKASPHQRRRSRRRKRRRGRRIGSRRKRREMTTSVC